MRGKVPLIYACSGCSSVAQMANWLAVRLDREGLAEMACVAGVGGDVEAVLQAAKEERPRIVLDGCAQACARACLLRHKIPVDQHLNLSSTGVKKLMHEDFDPAEAARVLEEIKREIFLASSL